MRSVFVLCLSGTLLTGCYSMPEQRDYVANPFYLPQQTQTVQPNFTPLGSTGEQYQMIMVNTPNGMVYKRCKVLNGQAVACF